MTHWSHGYIGLPYLRAGRSRAGLDCYGLIWLVYREVLGIALPSYAGETMDAAERDQVAALIADGRRIWPWQSRTAVGEEREFDMAVFRRGGIDGHIGIVIAPGKVLHVLDGGDSHVVSITDGRWRAKLVGLHHHEVMP